MLCFILSLSFGLSVKNRCIILLILSLTALSFKKFIIFLQFACVNLSRLYLLSIIYIIFPIIVNPADCTKCMFCFSFIHIIHNFLTVHTHDLSTLIFVHFSGKSSYTPIYPHYPQFFSVYHHFSTAYSISSFFCILVINFTISSENTPFLLDKKMTETLV